MDQIKVVWAKIGQNQNAAGKNRIDKIRYEAKKKRRSFHTYSIRGGSFGTKIYKTATSPSHRSEI